MIEMCSDCLMPLLLNKINWGKILIVFSDLLLVHHSSSPFHCLYAPMFLRVITALLMFLSVINYSYITVGVGYLCYYASQGEAEDKH